MAGLPPAPAQDAYALRRGALVATSDQLGNSLFLARLLNLLPDGCIAADVDTSDGAVPFKAPWGRVWPLPGPDVPVQQLPPGVDVWALWDNHWADPNANMSGAWTTSYYPAKLQGSWPQKQTCRVAYQDGVVKDIPWYVVVPDLNKVVPAMIPVEHRAIAIPSCIATIEDLAPKVPESKETPGPSDPTPKRKLDNPVSEEPPRSLKKAKAEAGPVAAPVVEEKDYFSEVFEGVDSQGLPITKISMNELQQELLMPEWQDDSVAGQSHDRLKFESRLSVHVMNRATVLKNPTIIVAPYILDM